MKFRILGPVQALDGERVVPVPAGRVRALLAVLLLHANQVVSVEELAELLWDERQPANPRAAVQTYVRRLRQALGRPLVRTRPQGYLIELDPDQLDLTDFRRLVERAELAAEPAERAALLTEAVSLWRGKPLLELRREPWSERLVEERLGAQERLIDARLELGDHAEVVAELTGLTREHPLRERFWVQLMLALHRCGRQADALAAYRTVSRLLADELGVDPGGELRQAHRAVLTAPEPVRPERPWVTQCQLPLDVGDFVGRDDLIDQLAGLLTADGAVPVVTVSGPPGAGKTALAVRVAHRLRSAFPDGQWYVRLDGAGGSPRDPADVLAELLRGSGQDNSAVPEGVDARAAALRARLAGRRVLLLLDDAGGDDQVRPLLPGVSGTAVLVTSRPELSGLAVFEGGRGVRLGGLDPDESNALLSRMLGAHAVRSDPAAAAELGRLCGQLPLALRIAAANVAGPHGSHGRSIGDYVAELRRGDRLAKLTLIGDPQVAVRAAFDLSYATLDAEPRRSFRLLGLVPGPDYTAEAAAALLDRSAERAEVLLDQLADANLVQRHATSRYQFHDLLRLYAAELADADPEREPAWHRLCDWYLGRAHAAVQFDYPVLVGLSPRCARPAVAGRPFDDGDQARRWLDAERANLVAATVRAADTGPAHAAWHITDALRRYMYDHGHLSQWRAAAHSGLRAARREGDELAEGAMLHALGLLDDYLADYSAAVGHYQLALERYRGAGFELGEAGVLCNLALVHEGRGESRLAGELLRRCTELLGRLGRNDLLGPVLTTLSAVRTSDGQLYEAVGCASAALSIDREDAARSRMPITLLNRAEAYRLLGAYDEALTDLVEADTIARELKHSSTVCSIQIALTWLRTDTGKLDAALEHGAVALRMVREERDEWQHAHCLNALGELHRARGQPAVAAEHHEQALRLAEANGYHGLRADALVGLASARHGAGDLHAALADARRALTLAAERELRIVECRALLVLAAVGREHGRTDAEAFAERALRIRDETGYVPPRELAVAAATR